MTVSWDMWHWIIEQMDAVAGRYIFSRIQKGTFVSLAS